MNPKNNQIVYIVDDEQPMCEILSEQLNACGYKTFAFDSAEKFLHLRRDEALECLVLDMKLPGMSGLELQRLLYTCNNDHIPIVFISGYPDVSTGVNAIKNGAVDYLVKPFSRTELLSAVASALEKSSLYNTQKTHKNKIAARKQLLTPREKEVFSLVVKGLQNKVIGDMLNITEKTVKVHRGKVMLKMQAASLVELVELTLI